jgi:hypothetical protein
LRRWRAAVAMRAATRLQFSRESRNLVLIPSNTQKGLHQRPIISLRGWWQPAASDNVREFVKHTFVSWPCARLPVGKQSV